ncbi:MAG: FtsQ-type POTRA domain-containing protein [Acidobacteria bacterium]|nr:FtsQ-type POTRA domain-containing protein [Acidobacteriota bacterium]
MYLSGNRAFPLTALVCLVLSAPAPADAQSPPQKPTVTPSNELDAFMEKVLARREVNRQTLKQYVLDETERFEILGPGRVALHRVSRDFTWYVRDGMHVRSAVRFDGVRVGEEERQRYEERWIRRERERQERKAKQQSEKREITVSPHGVDVSSSALTAAEPRFVSEAYFMDFKFEPGNYYLAGREKLEGKDVLRIEYYPTRLFSDDHHDDNEKVGTDRDDARRKRRKDEKSREREMEDQIGRRMNKTALVTLWVDPAEHQIVKYTFDNVWLDFLPGGWLVKIDDMRASMTMGQLLGGVWLPREMNIHAGFTLANGSFEGSYARNLSEYREADVTSKVRIPKAGSARQVPHDEVPHDVPQKQSGPYVPDQESQLPQGGAEIIGEIRVHGNAFLQDDEVLKLAGIAVGDALAASSVEEIRGRLRSSGKFESVEVRKRYRSLTSTTDVAIVLVVHERPGVTSLASSDPVVTRPVRRLTRRLMVLPIVSYADGYGFTYGGRVSTVDLLGAGERLSVPLTWGGTKRAALELERTFKRGPLTRIESSVAIWKRENPRFGLEDQRVELKGRAERQFGRLFRAGVGASRSAVDFGEFEDRLWTVGATGTFDTRGDPTFPGNAVVLSAGWTSLHFSPRGPNPAPTAPSQRATRYDTDARGYLRLLGQAVAAGRVHYTTSDATLPPYERLLLGGSSTVRGFRTGTFDGDRMLITSAEIRMPITSVLSGAKLGVSVFADAGQVWDVGASRGDADWHRGVGAGGFLIAPLVAINLDVARGLKTGDTRVHLSSGFTF